MADTKTTYPDGNAGVKRDGSNPNQGGNSAGQGTEWQSNPPNSTIPHNPNTKTEDCDK